MADGTHCAMCGRMLEWAVETSLYGQPIVVLFCRATRNCTFRWTRLLDARPPAAIVDEMIAALKALREAGNEIVLEVCE